MGANPDFVDLFKTFNDGEVRYLVVGGYAVIFHTEPRYTKDIDVWIEPTPENAARAYLCLAQFGAPLDGVSVADLADPSMIYQIGVEPNRIDIIMGVPGLDFASALGRAVHSTYGGQPIRVLAFDDLATAKQAAGRPQDLLDLERLEEKRGTLPKT
jgi:hypothetical protein